MKTSQEPDRIRGPKLNITMQRKLAFTFILGAAVLFALSVHMIRIMKDRGEEYQKTILSQQGYSTSTVAFRRGSIMDRNYTVLAYSEEVYNLILDPSVILYTTKKSNPEPNREATVNALAEVFGFDRQELEKLLTEKSSSSYIRYKRYLSAEMMNRFLEYQNAYNTAKNAAGQKLHSDKVTGVWFEKEYQRTYPYDTLACTLLGFSGAEAAEGHWGLEEYYNDTLTGVNGKSYSYINSEGDYESVIEASKGGNTIVSTIDYTIQSIVEEKVADFAAVNEYKNIGVLVMDPNTSEILAMATDKVFDPNRPTDLTLNWDASYVAGLTDEEKSNLQNQLWHNFTVNDAYTPGSVGKELTVAMALEEGKVSASSMFECTGAEVISGTTIRCSKRDGHGTVTLQESLMYSCNPALMQIGGRMDVGSFLQYQRNFGLGTKTGLDLPGESAGIIFTETNMSSVDLATSSFGQGYASTMIQMAAAYCSIVNGGYYYEPHMVKQILDENGSLIREITPKLVRQTVTESTAAFIRQAAYETVEHGSGGHAKIAGYTVAGKTGTAQKYPIEDRKFVVSFMSFAPAEKPEILVYVVIDEPESEGTDVSNTGSVILNRRILEEILPYLGVSKK